MDSQLDARAQHLFRVLVQNYIHDGQPVGSRTQPHLFPAPLFALPNAGLPTAAATAASSTRTAITAQVSAAAAATGKWAAQVRPSTAAACPTAADTQRPTEDQSNLISAAAAGAGPGPEYQIPQSHPQR